MTAALGLLCAGAVKGLATAVQQEFERSAGVPLETAFGAVGAMRDALRAGTPCDVFVGTEAMVASLASSGELRVDSTRPIGLVRTAIAVRSTAIAPTIDDAESLKSVLLRASAIYFPDATLSTAGAHVASMLERLGIADAVAARLRMFANGAMAMRELAASGDDGAIGCTQATEIRYTPGLVLVGPLPAPFSLATVYAAAVSARTGNDGAARRLIELLAGPESAGLRAAAGFDELPATQGPAAR